MKTYCLKNELIKGINAVMPITQTRNALPILANLLFKTEENAIVISATDLERAIICKIKGEIIEEGAITISAKKFLKIIMEFPSDKPIEISSDKSSQININIKSEKIKTKLTGIDASEYPAIPAFPTENSISINKNTLISMLKKTVFSVSKDPQRHILNGVYLAMEDGLLKMVSTDGRRLAYIFEEVMNAKTKKKAIVPTAGVNLILKIISGDTKEENIKMGLSENQIGIAFDDIVILSVLIEGSFPNYEQVIAPDNDGFLLPRPKWSIVINNKEMLNVIKRFKAMTDDDFIYGLFFSFDKNILKVSATATGIGCVEYEVTYIDKPGEIEVPFETSLNSEYIGDVLKNIEEDFSVFEFSIPSNPVLIRPQGNKKYLCVVMPMKMDI